MPNDARIPEPPREFRGLWVATVSHIDWPSTSGLSTAQQQAELLAILDRAQALKLNAIVLQVRPAADAFYDSPHEPWSVWLTDLPGRAPDPYWDPLAFAVEEAHARGLQLHAWLNPYRAYHPSQNQPPSHDHLAITRPDWVAQVGDYLWLDPGEPEVIAYNLKIVRDLVQRYDIDGIHLDDYFYPYPSYNDGQPFPDTLTYQRYLDQGGNLAIDDWRRENVNELIRQLYQEVHGLSDHCLVGISPFGIYRPGIAQPASIQGMDAYESIYADAQRWLMEGWVDYLSPQLYWKIANPDRSFITLYDWWLDQNTQQRHVWPGLYLNKSLAEREDAYEEREVLYQVSWTRQRAEARSSLGHVLFSANTLIRPNHPSVRALGEQAYAQPALIPASPWLNGQTPAPPSVRLLAQSGPIARLQLDASSISDNVAYWVVQAQRDGQWSYGIYPAHQTQADLRLPGGSGAIEQLVACAVDRRGVRSVRAWVN